MCKNGDLSFLISRSSIGGEKAQRSLNAIKDRWRVGGARRRHNEEQIISGCPIDGAISVRVDCGFGSYRSGLDPDLKSDRCIY